MAGIRDFKKEIVASTACRALSSPMPVLWVICLTSSSISPPEAIFFRLRCELVTSRLPDHLGADLNMPRAARPDHWFDACTSGVALAQAPVHAALQLVIEKLFCAMQVISLAN
jgi:hypothetical protein